MIWIGLALGAFIGIVSGMLGIGGGVLLIPILVYAFGMNQHLAQGTSLAMMLGPAGLFAVLAYYKAGHVDVRLAIFLALGFLLGGWLGGMWVQHIPDIMLRKIFAVALALAAIKMFFTK